jgi:pimeloyl-ACP methyl ester carboxylesterase
LASDYYREDLYRLAIEFEASKANFEAKQVVVNNKTLAYLENSQENKLATIIMLHGFSANKANWLRFSAPLADQYHLIALDLLGHGDSAIDMDQSYSIVDQVAIVKQFTEALGINKFHIVGNSMGGAISSLYSAEYPEQILSVTLISPAGIHDIPSKMDELLAEGVNPLIANNVDEFEDVMAFVMEDQPFIPHVITKVEAEKSVKRFAINQKIFKDIRSDLGKGLEKKFANIKAPTLIIWGEHDRAINVKNIDKYAQLIPGTKKLILEDIGHLAMLEAPMISAQAMLDFLPKPSS